MTLASSAVAHRSWAPAGATAPSDRSSGRRDRRDLAFIGLFLVLWRVVRPASASSSAGGQLRVNVGNGVPHALEQADAPDGAGRGLVGDESSGFDAARTAVELDPSGVIETPGKKQGNLQSVDGEPRPV